LVGDEVLKFHPSDQRSFRQLIEELFEKVL